MLFRSAEKNIENWFISDTRRPLILRGARQVGKSTLVRQFAASKNLSLIEINLERKKLSSISKEGIDVQNILNEIKVRYNSEIDEKTLIFFDEIQAQPDLLPALRYFYEEFPKIAVIAAGSLLELVIESSEFSMPVGRIQYFYLGPLTFNEYLIARKQEQLLDQLKSLRGPPTDFLFEQLTKLLLEYFFVGGMPAAVWQFIKTENPNKVREVHRSILKTYADDFPKYGKRINSENIKLAFERTADFIGKKMKYSEFLKDLDSREIKKNLRLLKNAHVIHFCYHSNCSGTPLVSQKDESVFKIYFLDIGLLNYFRELSWTQIQNFNENFLLTKGEIAEQFIAQHLAFRFGGLEEPSLYYWLRDKKSENAEVDFVIENHIFGNQQNIPIEVKAGKSGRLQSIKQFVSEKQIELAFRFDLNERELISEVVKIIDIKNRTEATFELRSFHLGMIGHLLEIFQAGICKT